MTDPYPGFYNLPEVENPLGGLKSLDRFYNRTRSGLLILTRSCSETRRGFILIKCLSYEKTGRVYKVKDLNKAAGEMGLLDLRGFYLPAKIIPPRLLQA